MDAPRPERLAAVRSAARRMVDTDAMGTAAIGAVTMLDLLAVANSAVSTTYDPFTPLVAAAFKYWVMVQITRVGFGRLELHLNKHLDAVT